ncbi:MAG: bifunctional 5,10-methylenetetrahydrofolate dehydrogenase/5,10-methenyltetrahydrofolate cyclohydrolase [Thermoproteota archaeon]|nr:bifunctional 5,10-methylenetetrahydrofolate dehydrogenase/5,10-methenyltetrahydrofolate cyclohydrolase [Candidatus Brockarchaeota archaeon]
MVAKVLSGKPVAEAILTEAKMKIEKLGFQPCLHIVNATGSKAQDSFIKMKIRACDTVGAKAVIHRIDNPSESEIISLIEELNKDGDVHGIIVQLPLPENISTLRVLESVDVKKDVDGLHPVNLGRLLAGDETRPTSTAAAVIKILNAYGINVEGLDIVIVNNSILVGRPLFAMLTSRMATVQVCHVKTKDLKSKTVKAEILISATGVPRLITGEMVSEGVVAIDVGTGFVEGKLTGDFDFESVSQKASAITPVPGGIGPVTVATLISNLVECASEAK